MRWNGPERIGRKESPDIDSCGLASTKSWEQHQREIAAKREALKTPLSLKTGYSAEPIDPEAALNRKPWTK